MRDDLSLAQKESHEQNILFQLSQLQKWAIFAISHQKNSQRPQAAPTAYEGKQLFFKGHAKPSHVLPRLYVYASQVRSLPLSHHCLQRLCGVIEKE